MEKKIFRYAERIADEKLSTKYLEWKTRPHLTLACFNDVDEKECIDRLKQFAEKQQALPAYIGSVGMFTDTKTIGCSAAAAASGEACFHQFRNNHYIWCSVCRIAHILCDWSKL